MNALTVVELSERGFVTLGILNLTSVPLEMVVATRDRLLGAAGHSHISPTNDYYATLCSLPHLRFMIAHTSP